MKKKSILFLSSNRIWAGSEVLWASSARQLNAPNYSVHAGVYYDPAELEFYLNAVDRTDLRDHAAKPSFFKRVLRKLSLIQNKNPNKLQSLLEKEKPDLVIISQGNNMDGRKFMRACMDLSIPYVTLTHLVTESIWPALNDEIINELRQLYRGAAKNLFVSNATKNMNEKILGQSFPNSTVVFNPFRQTDKTGLPYPVVENGEYKIALVGRIEIFHKGYDLLLDVLKQEKWRVRPIQFSAYGKGPHVEILKRLVKFNHILNFTIYEHQENLSAIWAKHHMLIMPSRMEGQALSLIEAMRFGRPAIVTNVGGATELIEESLCGFIAADATAESIDQALERAWEKRDSWEQLGLNAANAIKEKHPDDAVGFFNRQIEEILHRSAGEHL